MRRKKKMITDACNFIVQSMQACKFRIGRAILAQQTQPAHTQCAIRQMPKCVALAKKNPKIITGNFFVFKMKNEKCSILIGPQDRFF